MPDNTIPMNTMAPTFTPPTGAPNRGTGELSLDQFNIAMRASPLYQQFMQSRGLPTDGRVKLSRSQQSDLERTLARAGIPIVGGMHIDQGGNLNQKNRTGRNVAIAAAVAGAAFGGAALLSAGAAPAAAGGGMASVPGAVGGSAITAASQGAAFGVPTVVGGAGAATAAGTLASTSLIPGALAKGGGMSMASMAPAAGAARVLPPVIKNAGDNIPQNGGGWLSRGNNATSLIGMGVNGLSTYMGNRATSNSNEASLAEQQRQFQQTQDFLDRQEAERKREWEATEGEKKRQWDLTEAEKKRRYDAMQPYRDNGLVAMSQLANWSRPAGTAYRPTFQYRP